jgi:hypothetical protein
MVSVRLLQLRLVSGAEAGNKVAEQGHETVLLYVVTTKVILSNDIFAFQYLDN